MVFSSAIFLSLFLPITLGFYFLAQERLRNYVLLTASLFFYAWGEPKAALVMCGLIFVTYLVALGLEKTNGWQRKVLFAFGVIMNLSALFTYKYWMFFLNVQLSAYS